MIYSIYKMKKKKKNDERETVGINSVTEQPWYFGLKELNAAAH